MLFTKSQFAILASLVTLSVVSSTKSNHLRYRPPLSHHIEGRAFKSSNAEVEVCQQLGNCVVTGGVPVYSLEATSKKPKRADFDLVEKSDSTLPTGAKEGDRLTIVFIGDKAQDSGTLDFDKVVRDSLESVSKGAGFQKVRESDVYNKGWSLVVNEEKNQTLITQCRFEAGKDWSSKFPQVEAPLEQALVGAVSVTTQIAWQNGPPGDSCDPEGVCKKVKPDEEISRSFAPASMKAILVTFSGSSWVALGHMAYSVHCVKDTELTCEASKDFSKDVKAELKSNARKEAGDLQVMC